MTQTITRMYGSHDNAMKAVAELKKLRLHDSQIFVVEPPAATAEPGEATAATADDGVVAAIMKGMISKVQADIYAAGVRRGGTLVTVHPPFGFAGQVTTVLDSNAPIDSGVSKSEATVIVPDKPAPRRTYATSTTTASAASASTTHAGSSTTLMDDPAPFSRMLGWKVLSTDQNSKTELVDDPAPFSRKLGWKVLIDNPTPFSSWLGWKVLSDKQ